MATLTPWEVKGSVDYSKVIKDFGVKELSTQLKNKLTKLTGKSHHFIDRQIFFAHRDLNWLLDEYEKGNKFVLYTGRGPSSRMHLGHLVPMWMTKWLQDAFDVDVYLQFTDDEKFLFNPDLKLEDVQKMAIDNILDCLAVGFNLKKTHIILDTYHAAIMYPLALKVAKKITFSTVKSVFGFTHENNIGSIFYTAMQAVPAFLPSVIENRKVPVLIPHAIDQDPHFRATRDVLPKLGYHKPASIQSVFLPGLQGMGQDGKMSSSVDSTAIYLDDTPKAVQKKLNKYAFSGGQPTIEEHRAKGGNPNIDIAYQYLRFLDPDDEKLKKLFQSYKSGELLSGELKKLCAQKVNEVLAEHQARKAKLHDKWKRCLLQTNSVEGVHQL